MWSEPADERRGAIPRGRRAAALILAAALTAAVPPSRAGDFSVERVASGLSSPVFAAAAPGDGAHLYVVEKNSGRILRLDVQTGALAAAPFLVVEGLRTGSEQGLLGLAFHPDHALNGLLYVNLTNSSGDTEVRRYQAQPGGVADPASQQLVVTFPQPAANHNGGWLGFGPDGFLYIASGDGGGANDLADNGQDLDSLLGKLLRIDVDGDDFPSDPRRNYAIPPDNPFVGQSGAAEIWAYGLRNPWRPSFDRATGDLYIADVGQDSREEINFQPATSAGGENYGWRRREGTIATPTPPGSPVGGERPPGAVDPVYDYLHGNGPFEGFSVTGGYVYRGPIASLRGSYFFADFVTERIWSLEISAGAMSSLVDRTAELVPREGTIDAIASFAEDGAGNLYIIDLGGEIFRLTASGAPPPPDDPDPPTLPDGFPLLPVLDLLL